MFECDRNGAGWKELWNAAQQHPLPPSLIVCSHLADDWLWAEVLCMGADVLVKPFENEEVSARGISGLAVLEATI